MRGKTGRLVAGAIAVACVLSVVSCSSDDGGGDSESSAVVSEAGTRASGDPIRIGHFNPSEGPAAQAGVSTGQKAAVKYINEQLGGIGGRPIEVIDCGVDQAAPESTISCANQFVEAGVAAAVDGYNAESVAALPILASAQIPMVGQIAFNLATGAQGENRVYFGPPAVSFLVGFMENLKKTGNTSLTMTNSDLPGAHQLFDTVLTPLSRQLGIDFKAVYYPPAGPNFTALATTMADGNPAAAGFLTAPNDNTCTKLAQSLRSVKYQGIMFMAACTEFIDTLGAQAVGAQTYAPTWLPPAADKAPEPVQKNLAIAEKYIEEQGGTGGFYAIGTFATFVDLVQGLNSLQQKDFTGAAVLSSLKTLTGYQSFIGPVLNCTSPTSPNCTSEMMLFDVVADKKTEPVGGGFLTPNPAIMKNVPGAV
ncbi:ABC transporter substrate-binding protein [Williamsia soli]|uniref:ABC transporter substrate-binding protein n=1 Tax=Williamsia soli TaxID=364929 RepID=UPI001A9E3F41|nr:ABC transporter substrate-binding protein [Williamsia soli]